MSNTEIKNTGSKLFDKIMDDQKLKNDAALSLFLEVAPPLISKTRNGRLPVGAALIINIHKRTGMSIEKIETLIAS